MNRRQNPAPTREEANRQLIRAARLQYKVASIEQIFWGIVLAFVGLVVLAFIGLAVWIAL